MEKRIRPHTKGFGVFSANRLMIKLIAAMLMLIDHVGAILMPDIYVLRAIGGLSMPMFAFSLARAFRFAGNGSIFDFKPYFYRLLIFSIVSQLPFHFFMSGTLNIGFTWLLAFSLLLMITYKHIFNKYLFFVSIAAICAMSVVLRVDYGIYGVVYPAMFYYCYYKFKKPASAFLGSILIFAVFVAGISSTIQVIAILAAPLIQFIEKHDKKIIIPRWFFYVFYPVHITILLLVKYLFFNSN